MFKINNIYKPTMDWIVDDSDPRIREISEELNTNNITDYDDEMINKMIAYIDASYNNESKKYRIKTGVAITGIQIGYKKRVCYVHYYDEYLKSEIKLLIANPKIIKKSSLKSFISSGEGCLSVPVDRKGIVPRNKEIHFRAFDLLQNKEIEMFASDFLSICLQHEFDHMDGKLYYDRINIFNPNEPDEEWERVF